MTTITDSAFLRLHIEAVWGISIRPLDGATVELPATSTLPPWSLYLAHLSQGQVTIWRPGIAPVQRDDLLKRARTSDIRFDAANGMRREMVLRLATMPDQSPANPNPTCRRLTAADAPLLEAFESGSASYFLDPQHAPCFGVIIAGAPVSVAHSSRRTRAACELGINTAPTARRQGYATAATRAWTEAVQQEGLTPIYSAFAHNTASLRLAAATGYVTVSASVYGPATETEP